MSEDNSQGKTPLEELDAKLTELGVPEDVSTRIKNELGVASIADLTVLNENDLTGAGMKVVPARNLLKALKQSVPVAAPEAHGLYSTAMGFDTILPPVPSEESWLKSLKAGGVLRVEQSTVIAAVRATIASRAGLYNVPAILVKAMEKYAEDSEEQVGAEYFKLRKELTRRSYAEIFEAVDGLDGTYVTNDRKDKLIERINTLLWPALQQFQEILKSWASEYLGPNAQTTAVMTAMLNMAASSGAMVGGIMPPDTSNLRAAAEDVNSASNKVFAGTGALIASALAYEASKIVDTLQNTQLPAMIGAANREQMLRQLKVAVPPSYPRLEGSFIRYVLAILQIENIPAGPEEINYFQALWQLGSQIPWDSFGADDKILGIGDRKTQI